MNERVMQFRVGVMVLATLLIAGILMLLLGGLPSWKGTYQIRIKFPQAPGVSADTPVRKSGILIGRVTSHEFAEDGGVIVTARIDRGITLRQNEVCRIRGSLLGDAVLEFIPSGRPQASDALIDTKRIQTGVVAADPLDVMRDFRADFSRAINSVVRTSDSMGDTMVHVNRMLTDNEDRIRHVIAQADETLTVTRTTFGNVNKMIGDEHTRQQLSKAMEDLPRMLSETRQVVGRMNDTITLVDRNLHNLEGVTEPLAQRGPELVARVDGTLAKADALMDEMRRFSQALNSQQGTLGQLIHNRELYDNLNRTAANIEELTRKLRPIVDDARIFSDKIARHPGIIVRDAIRPGVGTKGVPGVATRAEYSCPTDSGFRLFERK
jgi:phospholipid/cholesterol/gamma-HCH transport system substrate-binding protein